MRWNLPKNTGKYQWTQHSLYKMHYYALRAQKVLGVIRKPERKEEGIVKNTIAVMQPVNPKIQNGQKIWKQEVWVMYQTRRAGNSNDQIPNSLAATDLAKPDKQIRNSKFEIQNSAKRQLRIISAWRYPGVSPKKNPIPQEILAEIAEIV